MTNHNAIIKSDISLAEWALVEEIRAGNWKNLDFPRIAREDFGLNGIEFVNTLFESPTEGYLKKLKQNAADYGITSVLIMCDEEGDGASETKSARKQFEINHRKWVDIAHYLDCHAIRTNCRGPENCNKQEALKWAEESYQMLLEYAASSDVKILIENHGGVSNDPEWMIELMNKVNNPLFGILPDWRNPMPDFDNYAYLEKTIPFAKGMSYRNQPTEELTARMIRMTKEVGYRGWYGIESKGREEVKKGIDYLRKYLLEGAPQAIT
ncbi:MAG TPA: TIM barrel protein [Chitinophagaceae bacterium]|nr:TIM barrel protein [Chitinophagaceae bacterium]